MEASNFTSRSLVQWDIGGESSELIVMICMSYSLKVGEEFLLDEYYQVERILGSGAYGIVCEVLDQRSGMRFAIKKCKNVFLSRSIALRTLREIRLLRLLHHSSIIDMKGLLPPENLYDMDHIYIIFEVMEADLSRIIRSNQILTDIHHQYFIAQLFSALIFLHEQGVIHRDLKPKNLLVNSNCLLKVADFGLAKCYNGRKFKTTAPMTDYVTTRWYRAPEILGAWQHYSSAIDMVL